MKFLGCSGRRRVVWAAACGVSCCVSLWVELSIAGLGVAAAGAAGLTAAGGSAAGLSAMGACAAACEAVFYCNVELQD